MALLFDGSNDCIYTSSFPNLAPPFSYGGWAKLTSASGSGVHVPFMIAGAQNVYHLIWYDYTGTKWGIGSRSGGTTYYALSTTSGTADWVHVMAVHASTSSRKIYFNGVNEGTDTTSISVSVSKWGLASRVDVVPYPTGGPPYYAGTVAEAAVWSEALTDDEVASLAKGFSPRLVRPQNLELYQPLKNSSDYKDIISNYAMTVLSTPTSAAHPRIYA